MDTEALYALAVGLYEQALKAKAASEEMARLAFNAVDAALSAAWEASDNAAADRAECLELTLRNGLLKGADLS